MTENEAIERVKKFGLHHAIEDLPYSVSTVKAFEMAIKALEEIQQYRAIGTVEESRVSDETLYRAVNKQNEFIRWYKAKYNEEPEFDIVILQIMMELKERRAAEGRKGNAEEKEQPETE